MYTDEYLLLEKYKKYGCEKSLNTIVNNYENFTKNRAARIYYSYVKGNDDYGHTFEDLEQEVRMAILKAINFADLSKIDGTRFSMYILIKNYMYVLYAKFKKTAEARNAAFAKIGFNETFFEDTWGLDDSLFYELSDNSSEIMNAFIPSLTHSQKKVFLLYLDRWKTGEIAEKLNCTPANVSHQIKKVRNLFKTYIEERF